MGLGGVFQVDKGFAVVANAVDEVGDLAVKGMMGHIAAIGTDGRNGDPVGLAGEELLGVDTVVADAALLAQQVDVEGVGDCTSKEADTLPMAPPANLRMPTTLVSYS